MTSSNDINETRREGAGPDGGRRDDGARLTRREPHAPVARPYVRVNLPPELLDRYEVIGELPSGGEADVLLVRPAAAGDEATPVVLKIYRHGLEPDQAALERIRSLAATHVVPINDCGRSSAGWWEEQEYIANGSLADLLRDEGPRLSADRLDEVIDEVVAALEAVHPVLHRDVKPTNVLVRAFQPLDLVLSDFGLARSTEYSHIVSTIAGSLAYQSPEALDGAASAARDWWAAGMIIAEAAIGRHPFYEPELGWPSIAEMRIALTTRAVPLDGIADGRIRLLCRGLLTRDPRHRWGAAEFRAWRTGASPAVRDEPAATGPARAVSIQPFVFGGRRCASPHELAPVLAQRWPEALRLISGAASQAPDYVRLILWLEEHGHEPALRVLEQGAQDRSFARRLFRLLRILDSELPPTFRGRVIDGEGLVALAKNAAAADHEAGAIVHDVYELGILGELAREEDFADLAAVDESWRAQVRLLADFQEDVAGIGASLTDDQAGRVASARILFALLDSAAAAELAALTPNTVDAPEFVENEPLRSLFERVRGNGREPAGLIAALLVHQVALDELPRVRATRHAAEERARSEREAAAREAREQAERERAQRHVADRAARAARLSDITSSSFGAARIIGGIGLLSSLVATIWASTTFEVANGDTEYGQGLRLLLAITAVTGLPALGASIGFNVLAARGRWRGRALSDIPSWHGRLLVVAAVAPPLLVFVSNWGDPWSDIGGGDRGPPPWFWLIGPAALSIAHIGSLLYRATRSGEPAPAFAVIGTATVAGLVVALVVRGASDLRYSPLQLPSAALTTTVSARTHDRHFAVDGRRGRETLGREQHPSRLTSLAR